MEGGLVCECDPLQLDREKSIFLWLLPVPHKEGLFRTFIKILASHCPVDSQRVVQLSLHVSLSSFLRIRDSMDDEFCLKFYRVFWSKLKNPSRAILGKENA